MGIEENVGFDRYPQQGAYLHHRARVCFHYESRDVWGTIVRDDREAPWKTIIQLDDGRFVLSTECMYSPQIELPLGPLAVQDTSAD